MNPSIITLGPDVGDRLEARRHANPPKHLNEAGDKGRGDLQ